MYPNQERRTHMINVFIVGHGRMGTLLEETIAHINHMQVVNIAGSRQDTCTSCTDPVDVIIDFSHPDNIAWIKPFIEEKKCAYICGCTGHSELQAKQVTSLSNIVPVVFQANFSFGIAVFQEMLRMLVPLLEDSFDMEVLEKHHNQKQDAPSGTAKMLVDTLTSRQTYNILYGRNGFIGKRQKEIGVHAIRGGSASGEHSVYFFGEDETFEIKHTANSKQVFINGALRAANFVVKQAPNLYTMEDIILKR